MPSWVHLCSCVSSAASSSKGLGLVFDGCSSGFHILWFRPHQLAQGNACLMVIYLGWDGDGHNNGDGHNVIYELRNSRGSNLGTAKCSPLTSTFELNDRPNVNNAF